MPTIQQESWKPNRYPNPNVANDMRTLLKMIPSNPRIVLFNLRISLCTFQGDAFPDRNTAEAQQQPSDQGRIRPPKELQASASLLTTHSSRIRGTKQVHPNASKLVSCPSSQ